MIAALISQFGPYIVGILGALAGGWALYFSGKKIGKSEVVAEMTKAKADETMAEAKATVEQITEISKGATDVQAEVSRLDAGNAADQLRNDWNRDEQPTVENRKD